MISLQCNSSLYLLRQAAGFDLFHHARNEVAGADKRVEDVYAFVAEAAAELRLQNLLNAPHHEVHNGLRRVDDSVRVGLLPVEALEKPLVDVLRNACFSE